MDQGGDVKQRFKNSYPATSLTVESVHDIAEGTVTSIFIEGPVEHKPSTAVARGCTTLRDGKRCVDFILAWDESYAESVEEWAYIRRMVFENHLISEGLEIEEENQKSDSQIHYVKLHAPMELLRTYSEILKLRMPMKRELCVVHTQIKKNSLKPEVTLEIDNKPAISVIDERRTSTPLQLVRDSANLILEKYIFVKKTVFPDRQNRFTAIYSRDKEYLFDVESPNFFTQAIRSRIVEFILDRAFFDEPTQYDPFVFGIHRLLSLRTYSAAYPLHDGDLRRPGTLRHTLLTEWASLSKWYRYQPLDYVREYFGVKIGLYFTWLGFYTHMLLPASVVGLSCFFYSLSTLRSNQPSKDLCEGNISIKMCPLCDKFCNYWDIQDVCFHAQITYLFDNITTIFFTVFMSVWAVIFLVFWKRYSAEITHRWDLTGFDTLEEQPRPEYLARVEKFGSQARSRINVVTGVIERKVPFWSIRFPASILSFSVVAILVALALATVIGVILYRMSLLASLSLYGNKVITSYAILFTTSTAASINLGCIVAFNYLYSFVAKYLTELEMHRTQTEFDDSLTLKMYLLQFVNYYASIFYVAFCKGQLVGHPANVNRFFGYRLEECGPGGCLTELCIQLLVIMIGKQAFNTAYEMLRPLFDKWWKTRGLRRQVTREHVPQWEKDYKLLEWGPEALFPEYLEMVLQYGFVTIFVAAFPLAPLFALINNIVEMRFDAKKLLSFHRRPVAQRVPNIGIWFRILDSISKLAVVTNGLILAFTSDIVPRLIYSLYINPDHNLVGYLNHSLSIVATEDLDLSHPPATANVRYCSYSDYREPPWSKNKYDRSSLYWKILAARLLFVVLFENVVVMVVTIIAWCIPDIPGSLKEQIRRESFITNEIIIRQEAKRSACGGGDCTDSQQKDFVQDKPRIGNDFSSEKKVVPNIETNYSTSKINGSRSSKRKPTWVRDLSVPPHDEALIHRPSDFGEIFEETV